MWKNYPIIVPKAKKLNEKAHFAGLSRYVIPALAMWAKAWDLYLLRPFHGSCFLNRPSIDSMLTHVPPQE